MSAGIGAVHYIERRSGNVYQRHYAAKADYTPGIVRQKSTQATNVTDGNTSVPRKVVNDLSTSSWPRLGFVVLSFIFSDRAIPLLVEFPWLHMLIFGVTHGEWASRGPKSYKPVLYSGFSAEEKTASLASSSPITTFLRPLASNWSHAGCIHAFEAKLPLLAVQCPTTRLASPSRCKFGKSGLMSDSNSTFERCLLVSGLAVELSQFDII